MLCLWANLKLNLKLNLKAKFDFVSFLCLKIQLFWLNLDLNLLNLKLNFLNLKPNLPYFSSLKAFGKV